jgi:hypothetical protein
MIINKMDFVHLDNILSSSQLCQYVFMQIKILKIDSN